jgi:hypothetical protein
MKIGIIGSGNTEEVRRVLLKAIENNSFPIQPAFDKPSLPIVNTDIPLVQTFFPSGKESRRKRRAKMRKKK